MPTLVKDGRIVADEWTLIEDGESKPGVIAPLTAWRKAPDGAGVWVDGNAEVEDVSTEVLPAPVVAVRFPAFADGRGLTFGSLLRARYGYRGELRAFGEIVPDLTPYMLRCGFDAFALANEQQAQTAIACMKGMSDHYQASTQEPMPTFRRAKLGGTSTARTER